MPLVNMKDLLENANREMYGVGAFNVANMEMVLGAVRAGEECRSPIILQLSQGRLPYSPLFLMGPMMMAAAETASVPIGVHFDHGTDIEVIRQALDLGFTSVMIDASHLPIDRNIELTGKVKEMADQYGASVEAEVGQLGGSEDDSAARKMYHSDPQEAKRLYDGVKIDAIALSIGNAHGLYLDEPKLDFSLLQEAKALIPIPLVLHGGTGISPEDFRTCIACGVRKINIATADFLSAEEGARNYCAGTERNWFKLSEAMVQGVAACVARHIRIFQSDGKA